MLARDYDEGEDLVEEAPVETGPATYPRHMRVDLRKLSVRGWMVRVGARGGCLVHGWGEKAPRQGCKPSGPPLPFGARGPPAKSPSVGPTTPVGALPATLAAHLTTWIPCCCV
jgi:hypothetical protein